MVNPEKVKQRISELMEEYSRLSNKEDEAERRAEEFILEVFEVLGWKRRSVEVIPQKRVRRGGSTTRVDYSFKRDGDLRASFYVEVKRFSDRLENVKQALDYGKNSSTRWVVLTNFVRWRVFNSDYFDQPEHAELFEFGIENILFDEERLKWLLLFARECGGTSLDKYAKEHKKWRESADIKDLLTAQLLESRKKLSKAIFDQNKMKFDMGQDAAEEVDKCVQHILDRIIFCRMLEDNGIDSDLRMMNVLEEWKEGDKRAQFYKDFLCPFFLKLHEKYDSTIFDQHRIDRLSIKNEDFIPVFESFYVHPKGLRYDFSAIGVDVLGHTYENYLSYKVKKTEKRTDIVEGIYDRKQSGIYYTPEFLVDFLVRATLGEKLKQCKTIKEALKIKVLDPACGSGTFLVRAYEEYKRWFMGYERKNGGSESLSQMRLNGETGSMSSFLDDILENCIYGIDWDPRAAQLARLNLFLRAADNPKKLPDLNILEADSLVADSDVKEAFIFERDLPLIHEEGGFDVVLGNPPWEKWKPDSQEFFESYDPGFKSLPTKEAKKRMEELMRTRPYLKKEWNAKLQEYEAYSTYYREHYEYQSAEAGGRKVSGDLDLYKIFTERAYQLAKPGGAVGFVVPSGIYTDLGAKGLRTMLFEKCKLTGLFSFENRGHTIFPDVHASYKPILLVFEKGGKTNEFPCAFFLHTREDLEAAAKNPTVLSSDFVKRSSPTSWNILEIKTLKDLGLMERMLTHPFLGAEMRDKWNVALQSGFHMTADSHLFREGLSGIPLLEGKNIHQFTHQWKEAPTSRYRVLEKDIKANLKEDKIYHTGYWMAYRLIASSTNERTLISAIIPPRYVCGHSVAIVKTNKLKDLCYLAGVLNSFAADYFMRQKVSANVTMFNFLELPVPRLASGEQYESIAKMAAQLVATTDEFAELKKEVDISYGITDENDRQKIRAKLDVAVAKLYGIQKDELEYIMTKFPIVDEKYKKKVLEEYS